MQVVLASSLGFCFGVRDALALVRETARAGATWVLGPIVHNPLVVSALEREGVRFAGSLEAVPRGARLVLTPHGVADPVAAAAVARVGAERVADATCPLVRKVHDAAAHLVADGRHVVVVGRADHVEVRGLTGSFPGGSLTVVAEESELERVPRLPRLGVVSQTTQPEARVRSLVAALERARPEADVRFVDTVCAPTKARQQAIAELATAVRDVVVVGGRASNNTRELVDAARARGCRVVQVESSDELDPRWFEGVARVGVAAGTSTPDEATAAVVAALEALEVPASVAARAP